MKGLVLWEDSITPMSVITMQGGTPLWAVQGIFLRGVWHSLVRDILPGAVILLRRVPARGTIHLIFPRGLIPLRETLARGGIPLRGVLAGGRTSQRYPSSGQGSSKRYPPASQDSSQRYPPSGQGSSQRYPPTSQDSSQRYPSSGQGSSKR